MIRFLFNCCVLACVGSLSGCAMCNKCGDECYTFYGGSVPRGDLCRGRVGSLFESAGEMSSVASATGLSDEISVEPQEESELPLESDLPETMPSEVIEEGLVPEVEMATEDAPPASQPSKSQSSKSRLRKPVEQENYLP
jgi:hypothetical protein